MALGIEPGDHVLDLCAAPGRYFVAQSCLYSHLLIAYNYIDI
jgi:23S rRNA U2552 (ribose-2'-O)-methylase RlmE/FtsJ